MSIEGDRLAAEIKVSTKCRRDEKAINVNW
jgi:hypothetical protein